MRKWLFGLFFALLALVSCNEDMLDPTGGLEPITLKSSVFINGIETTVCGTETFPLTAGQTYVVGNVIVSNDETNLYVTYKYLPTVEIPWFGKLHLWVGTDLATLPRSGGGAPVNGQFPYTFDGEPSYLNGSWIVTEYTFTIPLATIPNYAKCGNTLYVVAHAETHCDMNFDGDRDDAGETETAYAGSITGTGTDRWFFYDDFIVQCCTTGNITGNLQTAFAKPAIQEGGYVFVSPLINKKTGFPDLKNNPENYPMLNLTQNRWGWATNLAIAEDIIPPTLSYTYYVYHYRSFGRSYWETVPNGIVITNDETNLYVTTNYSFYNLRLRVNTVTTWVGDYILTVPGYPASGTTYTIPLSSVPGFAGCGSPLYVCAHADNAGNIGISSPGNAWQLYNTVVPISGTAEFPIYAGAGLNNTSNGTLVGKALVSYNGTTLKLTYDLDEGYEMEEVHIYADDALPTKVAPGQFGFNTYFDPMVTDFETEFEVPDTNGDGKIWFILHAVVDL